MESGVWPVVDVVSCSSSLRPLIPAGFPGLLDREPRRHILQAGSGCHGALSGWLVPLVCGGPQLDVGCGSGCVKPSLVIAEQCTITGCT